MSLHIAPARGWINDPNGLAFHDGRWHVFYQHNPQAAVHGNIHWGHSSSADLVHWSAHPIAFGPTPGAADSHGCWSGVYAGPEESGDTGEHGCAIYTAVHDSAQNSTVAIRFAQDGSLDTWSEPVVVAETPADVKEMRDPYLFTVAGRRYALLGAGLPDLTPAILLFDCDDLLHWRYLGVWLDGSEPGTEALGPAQIWECPQFVQVDGHWVLIVSIWHDHNLGPLGYLTLDLDLPGDLTGEVTGEVTGEPNEELHGGQTLPRPRPRTGGRVDLAEHAYAAQVLPVGQRPTSNRPLMLAWVKHDGLPDGGPDAVAGCLSLPTRLSLAGDVLVVTPDPALAEVLGPEHENQLASGQELDLPTAGRARLPVGGDWTLLGHGEEHPLPAHAREVWTDGEVAEVFGSGPSLTLRALAPGWRLRAGSSDQTVRTQHVEL